MTTFIKSEDLPVIEKLAASTLTDPIRKRVRLLLFYEAGLKTAEIAEKVDLSPGRVLYWRRMYLRNGMAVFGGAEDTLQVSSESVEPEKRKKKTRPGGKKKQKVKKMEKSKKKKSGASAGALTTRIKKATKKRAKLKKRLKGLANKKATAVRGRMKRLQRRIKKAKKALKKKRS